MHRRLSQHNFDHEQLRSWFLSHKRPLAWRIAPSPYSVWISEVMLQQTQVERVEKYFARWMKRFPTVTDLAAAPLETVMKLWEGLGYYSRARALHEAAQFIETHFNGIIPESEELLSHVKGLGPYTVNAIRAFAFHKKVVPVDANVVRVLTRFFLIEDDVTKARVKKLLQHTANSLLPQHKPWEIAEALIELGALHCRKKAVCNGCPLQSDCLAFTHAKQDVLPHTTKKTIYEKLYRDVAIIVSANYALVKQVEAGKVFAGLWEFPHFECNVGGSSFKNLSRALGEQFGIEPRPLFTLSEERQSFTRFRAFLYPKLFVVDQAFPTPHYIWKPIDNLVLLPFQSGHRRILNLFLKEGLCHTETYENQSH